MGLLRPATPLALIFLAAFVCLLLSTLSAPIIHSIPLGSYQGYNFGVLGYCNGNDCHGPQLGYSTDGLFKGGDGAANFNLPSSARQTLSSILIIHPIAALMVLICLGLALAAHFHGPSNSPRYLLALLILTIPTLLVTLLAFLVDVLLFQPHTRWGGWIVLAATILIILSTIVTCVMRRTLVSRKARKKRIAENADMNGSNYFNQRNQQRLMTDELPRADSPPPTAPKFATFDASPARDPTSMDGVDAMSTGAPSVDDRAPLNPSRKSSVHSVGSAGRPFMPGEDAPPMPGRPSMDNHARGGYRGAGMMGPALAAGAGAAAAGYRPGLRHQSSQGSQGSIGSAGRGGYGPPMRGYSGPPRGSPMNRGYGGPRRGAPRGGVRGGPVQMRGRGGYGPPRGGMPRPGPSGFSGPMTDPYATRTAMAPSPVDTYGMGPIGQAIEMNEHTASPVQPNFAMNQAQDRASPPVQPPLAPYNNAQDRMSPVPAQPYPQAGRASPAPSNQGQHSGPLQTIPHGLVERRSPAPLLPNVQNDRASPVPIQQQSFGQVPNNEVQDRMSPAPAQPGFAVPYHNNLNNGQGLEAAPQWVPPEAGAAMPLSPIKGSPDLGNHRRASSYYEDLDPRFADDPVPGGGGHGPLPSILTPGGYLNERSASRGPSAPVGHPAMAGPLPDRLPRDQSYESIPEGARSPAAGSEASHFTSISQRPVNPNWPGASYGSPAHTPRPLKPAVRKQEVLLDSAPDFELPGNRGGRRMDLGPAGRYPPAF